jgi:cysteine-rich repeat protein
MAGVDDDCRKWFRKQLKKRAKCNFLLLKKGVEVATKCTDAGPEPAGCDPADYTAAILALSHGETDQQTDPGSAQAVGSEALTDQVKCQKFFGKAAANFANKLVTLVQIECIDAGVDSESCRNTQSNSAKSRLDAIDNCTADQQLDVDSGLLVPDADPPCDECIDMAGIIDQKCLKDCFRTNIEELADGVIGDIPECGDGILQQGEFCDDGNLTDGDGCNSLCQVE